MSCLKVLAADRVIKGLREESDNSPLTVIEKIKRLNVPEDLQLYLMARSSPRPLFAVVELGIDDESVMTDFPDQVKKLQKAMAEFNNYYGSKFSCETNLTVTTVQDLKNSYLIIKKFMLEKEITDSEGSLNEYLEILCWAIVNNFENPAIEMLEKISADKMADYLRIEKFQGYSTLYLAIDNSLEGLAIKILERIPEDKIGRAHV